MTTFLWTIDDAGAPSAAMLDSHVRACALFEAAGVRSTWFVVPKSGGQPLNDEWCAALKRSLDAGHDVQLHGLTHEDCYEYGPPAWPAIEIVPSMQPDFDARRAELLPRYEVPAVKARLEEGLAIFDERLDLHPRAFRAPCGARSTGLYEALSQLGLRYESCVYISGTGYMHCDGLSGDLTPVWLDTVPHTPYRWYSDTVQAPILNEYTWRGAGKRSDEFVALAEHDVRRIATESPIAVLLMHTHGIADDYAHTERVIRRVVELVEGEGLGRFATMAEVIASGELDAAATVDGPRDLPV